MAWPLSNLRSSQFFFTDVLICSATTRGRFCSFPITLIHYVAVPSVFLELLQKEVASPQAFFSSFPLLFSPSLRLFGSQRWRTTEPPSPWQPAHVKFTRRRRRRRRVGAESVDKECERRAAGFGAACRGSRQKNWRISLAGC